MTTATDAQVPRHPIVVLHNGRELLHIDTDDVWHWASDITEAEKIMVVAHLKAYGVEERAQ